MEFRVSAYFLLYALLAGMLLLVVILQMLKFKGLHLEEAILVEYGVEKDSGGYTVSIYADYTICYEYSGVQATRFNLSLILYYGGTSGNISELKIPLGGRGCIDVPRGVLDFNVPILWVGDPYRTSIPYSELEVREPGVIIAYYRNPLVEATMVYRLLVEDLNITVYRSGEYMLRLELLEGYNIVDVKSIQCKDLCTVSIDHKPNITAYNVKGIREKIPSNILDLGTIAATILAVTLAIYMYKRQSKR
ncbi:MAG: hypothetical protein QW697_06485 [Acidilobaceae archaeon]